MNAPIIIGGGVAGTAAACHLARAGHKALVIEREANPHHKICGEFLSVETVAELRAIGIEPLALGAKAIGEVRLAHGRHVARARLPFAALSLSRRRLDEALIARAQALGARVERGSGVGDIGEIGARDGVFVATGKHALRGVTRDGGSGLTGFKMYYRLAPAQRAALDGAVELVLFAGGYAGLQLVEDDIANLCLLTRVPAEGLAGTIARAPHLVQRLAGAEPLLARPLAIANLPYGMVAAPEPEHPGRFRLGDQFAMIPSFTGDGMGLALTTARWAAQAWTERGAAGAHAYAAHTRKRVRGQVRLATGMARAGLVPGAGVAIVGLAGVLPGAMRAGARLTRVRD
jgi:flavin-dependent dehydrogenase